MNLITTKFMMPRPPSTLVERPGLLQYLTLTSNTKLVLVSAPAGAGKSTLLSQWLQHTNRPAAWLSLEPSDNDVQQFLLYLVGATQQVCPQLSELAEQVQLRGAVKAEAVLAQLVNTVSKFAEPCVLVLDDYHLITDTQIHAAAEFLLGHLPPQLCLALGSRTDPPFALGRLRVRGQLLEVRGNALRFGTEDTATLLNKKFGLELSPLALTSLEERTEGWIAGLQLAALSLVGRSDKEGFVAAFAGSHRHVADYLIDEVLARQTPEAQNFLQRTAVLGRFTAELCEAVVAEPLSVDLLKRLEANNLFLIPLDDKREWYRYHHLFAEFLGFRLRETEAELIPELNQRASVWFERHGWTDEAVDHAFQAGAQGRAAALVESVAFKLGIRWNNTQLIRHVQKLPETLLPTYPRLCIYYTCALTNTGQLRTLNAVMPLLERSEAHAAQPHTVRACVLTLRAYARLRQLDFAGATALCQAALAQLEPPGEAPSDEVKWLLATASNFVAYCHLHRDPRRAVQLYPVGLELCRRFGIFAGIANCLARLGQAQHHLGQLHAATEVLRRGLRTVERWRSADEQGYRAVNVGELHLNLARLHYEWNHLEEAEAHLRQARTLNELSQFPPVLVRELELACFLHLTRGEIEAAHALLSELDRIADEVHLDNLLYRQLFAVAAMGARLSLAAAPGLEHLLDEVGGWVQTHGLQTDDALSDSNERGYAILARLLLAQGRAEEALPLLERLSQAAEASGRGDDLIQYRLLQALGHQALGQGEPALDILHHVLELAEPEGYCRSFLNHGPPLRALLRKVARLRPSAYLEDLISAFPTPSHETLPVSKSEHDSNQDDLLLSSRQLEILRLLAAGDSNKRIAKRLELSPNTVKWYVQNLYADLGVNTRLQAVNRVRELGLDL